MIPRNRQERDCLLVYPSQTTISSFYRYVLSKKYNKYISLYHVDYSLSRFPLSNHRRTVWLVILRDSYQFSTPYLSQNLWELLQFAELDQVQPGHVWNPFLWLWLDSIQIQSCSTFGWIKYDTVKDEHQTEVIFLTTARVTFDQNLKFVLFNLSILQLDFQRQQQGE